MYKDMYKSIIKPFGALLLSIFILLCLSCTRQKQSDNSGNKDNKFVSLSPSITRQIIDLSCEDRLLGITSYCPYVKNADVIGTLVNPSVEKILLLNPQTVLMSLEDGEVKKTEALKKSGLNVHIFPKNENFEDISKNYIELAKIMGVENIAKNKLKQYEDTFESLKSAGSESAVFIISTNPLIIASGKSYIGDILRNSGYKNEFENLNIPYPVISIESLLNKNPKYIFVMDKEAFAYVTKHLGRHKLSAEVCFTGDHNPAYYTLFDYVATLQILTSYNKTK
jgi:ABC-type Fe3+-hydroxamate transport system substrate-binding protein